MHPQGCPGLQKNPSEGEKPQVTGLCLKKIILAAGRRMVSEAEKKKEGQQAGDWLVAWTRLVTTETASHATTLGCGTYSGGRAARTLEQRW